MKWTARDAIAYAREQRAMNAEGSTRASEELAARCVNLMLTTLHEYLPPGDFHRFREQV